MAAVDDALAGVFERLPVFDQVPGAFEIGGEYYVAASVVGDGKVAISLTQQARTHRRIYIFLSAENAHRGPDP